MKYVLITVRDILGLEILTEVYNTKEEAYQAMRKALYNCLKMDNDENIINLLDDGLDFSNVMLNENSSYIYQDCGETYHHWKIIEVN